MKTPVSKRTIETMVTRLQDRYNLDLSLECRTGLGHTYRYSLTNRKQSRDITIRMTNHQMFAYLCGVEAALERKQF